jgi:hypothetical protein
MLKSGLDDEGYLTCEQERDSIEENFGSDSVGIGRKLIVANAEGIDIAFLNLIAADDGHVEEIGQLFRERGFAGARPSCNDDTFGLVRHLMSSPRDVRAALYGTIRNP